MIDYLTQVQPLESEGVTDADIAASFRAIKVTNQPIDLAELLFTLNNRGMLVRLIRPTDTGEKWGGTVVDMIMYVNASVPSLAMPVNQWFSHITNDRNKLFDTTQPQYGSQLALLASQFGGQPGMPSVADFEAIADLGGGWKYADVTAETIADLRNEHQQKLIDDATAAAEEAARLAAEQAATEKAARIEALHQDYWGRHNRLVATVLDDNETEPTKERLVAALQSLVAELSE